MLKNTFLHIPGIGIKTEQRFWKAGIRKWGDMINNPPVHLRHTKINFITGYLQASEQHLDSGNPNYFSDLLPPGQHWRFFPEFRNAAVYLDIETTGLDSWRNEITTIALYDGHSIRWYVNGYNLGDFLIDIENYKVIVSYNGKCFDVPYIERYFGVKLNHAHLDLRYVLGSLGYAGGLKACETRLGVDRGDLAGIDGFFAVLLWHDYQTRGNQKALESLLAYNIQDVLTLEHLMVMAYNMKLESTPFCKNRLPTPTLPSIPFKVDRETVESIRGSVL